MAIYVINIFKTIINYLKLTKNIALMIKIMKNNSKIAKIFT